MTRVRLGPLEELSSGSARVVPYPDGVPPRRSLLVIATQAGPRAYWNVCQHLPIPLDAGAGALAPGPNLVCVTHGAAYDAQTGRCVSGPCVGKGLEPVAVEVEDGVVYARW